MDIVLRAAVIYAFVWLILRGMGKRELAQLNPFEIAPDPCCRLENGCIARYGFQPEARGGPCSEERLPQLAAMDGRAIPHHQSLPRNVAQQLAQAPHHPAPADTRPIALAQQAPRARDPPNG